MLNEQFKIVQMIGEGSFGKVYLAHDLYNNSKPVAIKTESTNASVSHLFKEIQNHHLLLAKGFPRLIKQGINKQHCIMYIATDLLGPSLCDLSVFCGGRFSLKTTLMLYYQILERLQYMHEKHLIHCDLKPENIMMGMGDNSSVAHLIDFGLTRSVINPTTGNHIEFVRGKNLKGTICFVSINAH